MTHVSRITGFAVFVLLALGGVARAQLGPYVMGENSRRSFVGLESGIAFYDPDNDVDDDTIGMHFDLVADVRIGQRFKVNLRFPLVFATEPDTGVGIGNLTVGGRYLINLSRGGGTIMIFAPHGSVSLPTASDSDDAGIAAGTVGYLWAAHDFGWYAPNLTALRFGGDFSIDTQSFFLHAQLGLHHYMYDGDDETLLRLGLGTGVKVTPLFAIVLELSHMTDIDATAVDLGVRWRSGNLILGLRGFLPVDDRRDEDSFGLGFDVHAQF